MSLLRIQGMSEAYAQQLESVGVQSTGELLEKGATPQGRREIAARLGVSETMIQRWVNLANLFRIHGIGKQYAELLEAAGVDTVAELAQRHPDNLHRHLVEINRERKLVRKLPRATQVREWVKHANKIAALNKPA